MPWTRPQVELQSSVAADTAGVGIVDHHYEGSLFPTSTLIPVTVICVAILVVGVAGNTMTILIIQHFKDMKTTTNLYLSSMAVSDLLIFLCLPFDLYRLWKYVPWLFGEAVCLLYHYVFEGCTSATILHIAALSVERYLAISFPLRTKVLVTKRRVQYIIAALWGFALASSTPTLFLVGVEYDNHTAARGGGQCKHTDGAIHSGRLHIMLWVSTAYFVCPMLCLVFLYGSIGLKLWKSKSDVRGPSALARERSHRQTVKILVVVVLAFIICWLPYHIGRNLFAQVDDYDTAMLSQNFNMASMVLCYLSASINPVVYNLMSRKYRSAAKRLFLLHQRPGPREYNRRLHHGRQSQLSTVDPIENLTGSTAERLHLAAIER
ncbi:growth hormone secretagogue receptor type 1 [Phycodurus eques]|uniref:growth hormone secretagogue receptor type 1 n=1 Tax=Phycodurus eques TaxID=693459 RepID=UPI002ACE91DD|nr:growth hormone secretagogue receptor type 1 [Phycodurus eques]